MGKLRAKIIRRFQTAAKKSAAVWESTGMTGGIKKRWLFNNIGFLALIMLFAVSMFSIVSANYYYTGVRVSMESRAKDTVAFINRYFNKSYNDYYQSAYRYTQDFADGDKLELQFVNKLGRIEFSSSGLTAGMVPNTADVSQALESAAPVAWMGTDAATNERIMAVSSPLLFSNDQVIGVMRYVTSLEKVDRQILYSIAIALGLAFAVMGLVVVSNLYFIRSIVVPIQELNEIAKKIAAGSYGVRLEKHFNDEIGELCDAINNMSSEISAAEKMKTDFISSVSHELRTPLTAIAGWGETLLSGDSGDPAEIRKGIRIILSEARRLSKLVEELLDFTRIEGGRLTLQMEEADILSEFEEAVFMYMETLKKDGIELTYSADDDIPNIVCDRARLRQVFLNILDNAAKHGAAGKRIDASILSGDGYVDIVVRDYGAGIPAEELPRVKMKFYKGSSKARGSGIGLAVSDEIVRLHGGTLEIDSTVGEGTSVTIHLPVNSAGL